jgi:hypothetical protein
MCGGVGAKMEQRRDDIELPFHSSYGTGRGAEG